MIERPLLVAAVKAALAGKNVLVVHEEPAREVVEDIVSVLAEFGFLHRYAAQAHKFRIGSGTLGLRRVEPGDDGDAARGWRGPMLIEEEVAARIPWWRAVEPR